MEQGIWRQRVMNNTKCWPDYFFFCAPFLCLNLYVLCDNLSTTSDDDVYLIALEYAGYLSLSTPLVPYAFKPLLVNVCSLFYHAFGVLASIPTKLQTHHRGTERTEPDNTWLGLGVLCASVVQLAREVSLSY